MAMFDTTESSQANPKADAHQLNPTIFSSRSIEFDLNMSAYCGEKDLRSSSDVAS
jgi:hypothetical protein